MVGICQHSGFRLGKLILREMHVHLVTIEIGVVGVTIGVVHANNPLIGKDTSLVTHDGGFVESWLTVHQDVITSGEMTVDLLVTRTFLAPI